MKLRLIYSPMASGLEQHKTNKKALGNKSSSFFVICNDPLVNHDKEEWNCIFENRILSSERLKELNIDDT